MVDKLIKRYITVTSGMRGSFAVLIGEFEDEQERRFEEPINTSPFSGTPEQARKDGEYWAKAEEVPFVNPFVKDE